MKASFIQDRITATKLQIISYEDAALALSTGAVQSYKLDTGQTIQTVTRLDLASIQKTIDALYNRCTMLETRLGGGGTLIGKPEW